MKVRFDQLAINVKEKKKPTEEDRHHYIGLEHLDSGSLTVSRWGADVAPKGEKLLMKKGDVLFGKRRAYQKKVAIAPFDGIFSAHGMVLRPNEKIINKAFFPLFISSDYFLDAAIALSVGSLSPTINRKDLARLEFELPSLEKQRELAEVLWAIEDTRTAYQRLEQATDELVKSRFVEMFGDPVMNSKGYPVYKLSDITTSRLGKMLDKKRQTGKNKYPYLANYNVQWFRLELDNLNEMDFDEADRQEFELRNGDLLVCEGGEVGRCAIWRGEKENCYFQKALHRVRCDPKYIIPEYLGWTFYWHSQYNGFIDAISGVSTIAHLPGDKLKQLQIIVPPLDIQNQFADFVALTDKSKLAVQQSIETLQMLKAKLMQDYFC